jgi:hypothetical protein
LTAYLLDINLLLTLTDPRHFLLGLAIHKGGKLTTIHQHLPATALQHGTAALQFIVP